jgi:hypothetical protein
MNNGMCLKLCIISETENLQLIEYLHLYKHLRVHEVKIIQTLFNTYVTLGSTSPRANLQILKIYR